MRARKNDKRAIRSENVDDALAWMDDLDDRVEKVTQGRRPKGRKSAASGRKPKASGRKPKSSGRKPKSSGRKQKASARQRSASARQASPLPTKKQYPEPVPRLSRRADLLGHVDSTKLRRAQVMSDRRDATLSPAEIRLFEEQKQRTRRLQKRRDAVRDTEEAGAEVRRVGSRQAKPAQPAPKAKAKSKAKSKAKTKSRGKKQARQDTAPIDDALAWMDDADERFDEVVRGARRPAKSKPASPKAKAKAKAAKTKAARAKAAKTKAAKAKAAKAKAARRQPKAFEISDVVLGADQLGPPAELSKADVSLLAQSSEGLFVDEAPDTSDERPLPSADSGELTFLDAAPRSKRLYPKKHSPSESHKRAAQDTESQRRRDDRRGKAEDLLTWMEDLLGAGDADAHAVRRQLAQKDYDRSAMVHLIRSAAGLQAKKESGDELPSLSSETGRFDRRSLKVLKNLWTQAGKGQVTFGDYVTELEQVMGEGTSTTPSGRVVTQRPVTETVPVPVLADLQARRESLARQRTGSSRLYRLEAQLEAERQRAGKRGATSRVERLENQLREEDSDRRRARSPQKNSRIKPLDISPDPLRPDAAFDGARADSDPFGLVASDPFANDPFANDPFVNDPFGDAATERLSDPYGGMVPDPFAKQGPTFSRQPTSQRHADDFGQEPVARGWQSAEFQEGDWSSYSSPALPTSPPPLPHLPRTLQETASSSSSIEIIY